MEMIFIPVGRWSDRQKGSEMFSIGDRVKVWWQGKQVSGSIIEVVHSRCYRVRLYDGQIVYRLEADIDAA